MSFLKQLLRRLDRHTLDAFNPPLYRLPVDRFGG